MENVWTFVFINEIFKNTVCFIAFTNQGWRHRGRAGGHGPLLFCIAKRKKGDKGKKGRVSKQILPKGCHQGQNIIALAILERLEFENFSCQLTMVTDNTF